MIWKSNKYIYKIRDLSFYKSLMAKLSIKYSWKEFWNSIDICELWNSLLWFWEFFQTVWKEKWFENLTINVDEAKPWCFDLWLSIDANTLIWGAEIIWGLVWFLVDIIDIKKFFKWEDPAWYELKDNWNIAIKNNSWEVKVVQKNTYLTYIDNKPKLDKELQQAFSPIINDPEIQNISIWEVNWKERNEVAFVNEEDAPYFNQWWYYTEVENWRIIQWRIVTMNMDTYRWTIEYERKKEYIDFSNVKLVEDQMQKINSSMMNKTDIVIKCNIEYEKWKIKLITIAKVVDSKVFEE